MSRDSSYLAQSEPQTRPVFALICGTCSAIFFTMSLFLVKETSRIYPEADMLFAMLLRNIGSFIVLFSILVAQGRAKEVILYPVAQMQKGAFFIGTFHIVYVMCCIFYLTGSLPLTVLAIFLNTAPVVTTLAGAIFVKTEKITFLMILQVLVSFSGVMMIVLGNREFRDENQNQIQQESVVESEMQIQQQPKSQLWNILLLATTPFVITMGNFQLAKINKMPCVNPFFVPIWSFLFSFVVLGLILSFTMKAIPDQFGFWFLSFICMTLVNVFAWYFKMLSYSADKASKIGPLVFLESFFAIILDRVYYGTRMNAVQIVGSCFIALVFLIRMVQARIEDAKTTDDTIESEQDQRQRESMSHLQLIYKEQKNQV